MTSQLNRRTFLKGAATGAAALLILNNSRSAFSYQANEKLNIALVGVGGRGRWFVGAIPNLRQNVVAMCDVNDRRAELSFKELPDARKFHDFRKMLDEMDRQIDAVTVATTDHSHAVISAAAMRAGKHVFCEKPLTRLPSEARTLRKLAAECKVATQMGNQGTASEPFRRSVELVQAGVIGKVREVHAWNTGGGPGERPKPTKVESVPDYLKWDLWLGPASFRPFNSQWLNWHGWRDFGTGNLGNWASHTMNVVFKGLKLDSLWDTEGPAQPRRPVRVQAEVSGIHELTFPRWEIVRYVFGPRAGMPAVTVNWYNGPGQAPGPREMIEEHMGRKLDWGDAGEKKWKDHAGCLLIGTDGLLHSTGHNMSFTLHPQDKFEDFKGPERTLPRCRGHEREWLEACRGGAAAMSNFDYAARLAEFVLLGNVATQFDHQLEFDPRAMKITNDVRADKALRHEYRDGWSL
ncbi:MAG: Gfo/Idh/MocA family oxidoreductase [Phycisphaerales bacterium]|nr:MAG: Gfo/Idh/MocA family oxidoreductase [Phycisphaerales bacterium]